NGNPLAFVEERGRGQILTLSSSFLFTNLALGRLDTGESLAALLTSATEAGRRNLVFDEFSHGDLDERGIFGWITGTSLRYPCAAGVVFLFLLAWRGGIRNGSLEQQLRSERRAKEEHVVSVADLLLRAKRFALAARWLVGAYKKRAIKSDVDERKQPIQWKEVDRLASLDDLPERGLARVVDFLERRRGGDNDK
ncbi:MAG: hypothetical protein AAF517_26145, partial [Planctomycetota bacterium]